MTADATTAHAASARSPRQLVTFRVGDETYGVPILAVREINHLMQVTRVPQSPASVQGVINLRGTIVPVVDLRDRFGMLAAAEGPEHHRVIVVEVRGELLGFQVDRVDEVLALDGSVVERAPDTVRGAGAGYVEGIGKLGDTLLILLDLESMFPEAVAARARAA